jgi:prepilin-type N-terminal cleavage/methylation domain-containing protein
MSKKFNSLGYSLVELSIVLVIIGILGFFSIKFISQIGNQTLNQQFKNDLERANQAISGFVFSNHRLPCPDISGNGQEECGVSNKQGFLPVQTLGIESSIQKKRGGSIRYGVYRNSDTTAKNDKDLAVLKDRYEPLLPPQSPSLPTTPEVSAQSNGLDFCLALKTASLASTTASEVNVGGNGINVAYAIADSGTIDADNNGNLFDGTNATGLRFEEPHSPHLNDYDDNVLAVSFNELSGRLNCPKVLAQTNGTARASFAAYDMWLLATQYKEFRDFNVKYLESMVEVARAQRDLAAAGVALAVVSTLIGAADVALDFTGASAIGVGLALLATADAAFALVQAIQGLADAEQAVVDAKVQQTEAIASLAKALAFKTTKLSAVKSLDQRGLIR